MSTSVLMGPGARVETREESRSFARLREPVAGGRVSATTMLTMRLSSNLARFAPDADARCTVRPPNAASGAKPQGARRLGPQATRTEQSTPLVFWR